MVNVPEAPRRETPVNGIDLIGSPLNQQSGYFTPNDHVRQTMHPGLLYTIAQQHAEQLRRQAEHSRLSREIRCRTMERCAPRVLRWLGFGSARSPGGKDQPGMGTTTELSHKKLWPYLPHRRRYRPGIKRENSRV
jgi:hypothetical protein